MRDCSRDAGACRRDGRARAASHGAAGTAIRFAEPERLTVAEAFERFAGIDLLAIHRCNDGATDRDALAASLTTAGMRVADDDTWSDLFSRVIVEKIEPNLGFGRATILDRISRRRGRSCAADGRMIRASPNASSFMPAASNSPMPSVN